MKEVDITIVRIYITESSNQLKNLMSYLKDDAKVKGASLFRAISGYGDDGKMHSSTLMDLSLDLPVVIEFCDEKSKVKPILEKLNTMAKPEHIVFWDAKTNIHA